MIFHDFHLLILRATYTTIFEENYTKSNKMINKILFKKKNKKRQKRYDHINDHIKQKYDFRSHANYNIIYY